LSAPPPPWPIPSEVAAIPSAPASESAPALPIVTLPARETTTPAPPTGEDEPAATTPPSSAPVGPLVTLSLTAVPPAVHLTAEGTRDWVQWGLNAATSVDRRGGGTGEIHDLDAASSRGRYDNNPSVFGWTGGTPTATASRTPTGVYRCGKGASFTLAVPAS